ncbi:MAG: alpha/beta hydrolase [Thermoguttaceae bacterium]
MRPDHKETDAAPRGSDDARPRRSRTFRWIGGAILLAAVAVVLVAMSLENRLIFHPVVYPEGNWNPPGLRFEDAWFRSADGTRLHGWYVPKKNARAAVLFCHGNGGNLTHRLDTVQMLNRRAGASVLIFDYRGYGRSEGTPSAAGALADARAARAWLAGREKIAPRDVVVMGESLGGAVAVDLAARDGARALVLESTFSSLPDVAAFHYPWLPVRWFLRTRLDSASLIHDFHGPLLQAHGDMDTIVPLPIGRRLFEAANQPKQFMLMPGHDHNDLMPADYFDTLREFFESLPQPFDNRPLGQNDAG